MVLWYNGKMLATPNNLYRMSTATSVANSGTGANSLTKPAGTETAAVMPGGKYAVYIPTEATFTTSFNADAGQYTIFFYAKPNPGAVLTVAGNTLTYSNNSFKMVNDVGDSLSIPFDSHRAHLIAFTYSDMEAGVYIDGNGGVIPAATTDVTGPLTVTLLGAGGILGDVYAFGSLINNDDLQALVDNFLEPIEGPGDVVHMDDEERDLAWTRSLPDESVAQDEIRTVLLERVDCMAFKLEYTLDGNADVYLNGHPAYSGIALAEEPDELTVVGIEATTLTDIRMTEYIEPFVTTGIATVSTSLDTGRSSSVHLQDDNAGATGDTTLVLNDTVNTIGGWFRVKDGTPLPDVTMSAGVLTGTGLYVNGKAYTGQTLQGWYFLTKTGATTGTFTTTVPVHSYYLDDLILTAAQIDDLYESFFGNPIYTTAAESMGITEEATMVISSEWSIVASG